jgi:radical SAM superfamily enzyme YgiQ (UPF0313 family)
MSPSVAATAVGLFDPKLIVVVVHGHQPSASTQKMPAAVTLVKAIKREVKDVPVLIVGGHPAALPEQTLKETGADYVCTGEGFIAIERLAHGAHPWGVIGGDGYHTPSAPNVSDLDHEVPGGCWDLLPMSGYRSYAHHAWSNNFERQPYASIYTSLGCPWRCSFCMIQSPFRRGDEQALKGKANSYRMWSADHVLREVETLVERYNVVNIRIDDEMFVLNESHVFSICDKITERYGDRLNFWCYGRVDCTRPKFLYRLRRAGFKWLCLGIESVSDEVRDGIDKSQYGATDIIKTVRQVQQAGINVIGNYMFGLPKDTLRSMENTLQLALELKTEYVNFYATVAYPGSALWDEKIMAGWQPPQNWLAWSFHSKEHTPLGTETLSPVEVLRFRDEAFKRYFLDGGYRNYVWQKFGQRAIEEIDGMLSHDLKRDLFS